MAKEPRTPKKQKSFKEKVTELQDKLLRLWLDSRITNVDEAVMLKDAADKLEPIVNPQE